MLNALLSVVVYFSVGLASSHDVVSRCVSRQGNDRSAVHQLDQDRSGRRAGRGNASAGAGLADFGSYGRRSRRRRGRAIDDARRCISTGAPGHGRGVCAQRGSARGHRPGAVARSAVDRASDPRAFTASDRLRPRRHRPARQSRDALRHRQARLRSSRRLTAVLILRALLSNNLELFDHALSELSDLPQARVSALLHERGGASLRALLIRAGLPESTFAAFKVALEASQETGYVDTVAGAARLRRRMVERVLTHCETDRQAAEPLLILLRRFATESAREEARMFCSELIAEQAIAPIRYELIAA